MAQNAVLSSVSEDGFIHKKWTVKECRFLVDNGLLTPGKFELIDGEIVFKIGQGRLHIFVVTRILAVLTAIFGADSVQSQAPIGIGEYDEYNDPEPDAAVLRGTVHLYLEQEPDPATDMLLVVEASNTTLRGDLNAKARIYAAHGIPEYWVVAIPNRELVVHRQPTPGGYADVKNYGETESVSPLAAPSSLVLVSDFLP